LHPKTVADGSFGEPGTLTQFRSRVSNVRDPQTEARYDRAVSYVDDQLMRIVDWLKGRGMWEETVLMITADHGDALHDRGIYGHPQHYTYEELLSVPLIVRLPDSANERIERSFSLGWLHELVAEVGDTPTMDAPLLSDRESHLSVGESTKEIVADSISHRGHSIVVWQGATKYVRQTYHLTEDSESAAGKAEFYRLNGDRMS
jgi:choline-sulfatase